jgi:hypothetical protein
MAKDAMLYFNVLRRIYLGVINHNLLFLFCCSERCLEVVKLNFFTSDVDVVVVNCANVDFQIFVLAVQADYQ